MTQKAVKQMMKFYWENNDTEDYEILWDSIRNLYNMGLVEKKVVDAMVAYDHELFNGSNK